MDVRINVRAAFWLLWPFLSQNLVLPCTARPSSARSHRTAELPLPGRPGALCHLARTLVPSCSALHMRRKLRDKNLGSAAQLTWGVEMPAGMTPGSGGGFEAFWNQCQGQDRPSAGVGPVLLMSPAPSTDLPTSSTATNRHRLSPETLPLRYFCFIYIQNQQMLEVNIIYYIKM